MCRIFLLGLLRCFSCLIEIIGVQYALSYSLTIAMAAHIKLHPFAIILSSPSHP
jgi:hypothetical protein